jgi:hypothetical protein
MKSYTATLLAPLALAQVSPNMGYDNASLGGQFGYGYGLGNGFDHSDGHSNSFGHQMVAGSLNPTAGVAYTADQASDHIFGYDSVKAYSDADWENTAVNFPSSPNGAVNTVPASTVADVQHKYIKVVVNQANVARKQHVRGVMDKRVNRLTEIHNDNLLKIEAPFDLQLDLLDREIEDVITAQTKSAEHATSYF